jgi:hypothetical protein
MNILNKGCWKLSSSYCWVVQIFHFYHNTQIFPKPSFLDNIFVILSHYPFFASNLPKIILLYFLIKWEVSTDHYSKCYFSLSLEIWTIIRKPSWPKRSGSSTLIQLQYPYNRIMHGEDEGWLFWDLRRL